MSEYPLHVSELFRGSHGLFLEQLSDEDFWRYARARAFAAPAAETTAEEVLVCKLEQGHCLLPLAVLREVIPPPHQFALLPAAPLWMSGVVSWHGETIPVIDLAAYLAQKTPQACTKGTLLIVQCQEESNLTIGLYVFAVTSIIAFEAEQLSPLADITLPYLSQDTQAIKGLYQAYPVLDTPVLLTDVVQQIKVTTSYE